MNQIRGDGQLRLPGGAGNAGVVRNIGGGYGFYNSEWTGAAFAAIAAIIRNFPRVQSGFLQAGTSVITMTADGVMDAYNDARGVVTNVSEGAKTLINLGKNTIHNAKTQITKSVIAPFLQGTKLIGLTVGGIVTLAIVYRVTR